MNASQYPPEFLERLRMVTRTRAKTVIDHILEHGFVTTEELRDIYGYHHPPRGARDVREEGIPLETFRVRDKDGRSIGAYRFGDPEAVRKGREGGRKVFSRQFKNELLQIADSKCQICSQVFESRYLQVDHRVPYEVSGDTLESERNTEDYMLLCGSCNRAKSWSCEHCANWLVNESAEVCKTCYWGHPESYTHIALKPIRRLDMVWTEDEVDEYEDLRKRAEAHNEPMPDYVKSVLRTSLFREEPG